MKKKPAIFCYLEEVAKVFPAPMYWEDINNVIVGANDEVIKRTGALSADAFIGKTAYDLYPHEMADCIIQHNDQVMRTGVPSSQEEVIINITTGERKYFQAYKAPLFDEEGNLVGLVGTSIDITVEKEAERLRIEVARLQQQAQDNANFQKLVEQVVHDVRSPLSSLLMVARMSSARLLENERVAMREATSRITDILENMLRPYREEGEERVVAVKEAEPESMLVSSVLLQLVADKRYEYQGLPIQLEHHFASGTSFAFIDIVPSDFKRMISNLMNNARDAFDGVDGEVKNKKIRVGLEATGDQVVVEIRDNGKGMPAQVLEKIRAGVAISAGKGDAGHGVGLQQVRGTLHKGHATLGIESTVGEGTVVRLTFGRVAAPDWMGDAITLYPDDTIVVLDDDSSIHSAWDSRFAPVLAEYPRLKIKHFREGDAALYFFSELSPEQKTGIFFLSDYELLAQKRNGLEVIEASGLRRCLLVTSHYADAAVRKEAGRLGVKIVPKDLAAEVVLHFNTEPRVPGEALEVVKPDLVVYLDDDEALCRVAGDFMKGVKIDFYHFSPTLLKVVDQYPLDTLVIMDNNLSGRDPHSGIEVAEKLHALGYTELCLLTGNMFREGQLPAYLTVVSKMDLDLIQGIIEKYKAKKRAANASA